VQIPAVAWNALLGFDVIAEARDVPGWGTTGDLLFVSAGGRSPQECLTRDDLE
jgi:hypothetical protein